MQDFVPKSTNLSLSFKKFVRNFYVLPNSDSLELFGRLFSVFGKSEIPLLLKIQQKNKKNSELNISIFFVLIFKMAVSKKGCVITERTVSPQHCLPQRGPISKKFLCKSALAQATGAEMAIGVSPPKPSLRVSFFKIKKKII